jgi:hypothetical protein
MKIITASNSRKLSISKSEWLRIGAMAGWIQDEENQAKLEEAIAQAKEIAEGVKKNLQDRGYSVEKVNYKEKVILIKRVSDQNGKEHEVDIEIKPWANKNNKRYELRSGVFIMAGPYSHKKFRRKRFSPKNVEKMIDFLEKVFKYSNNMEKLRKRRSEKAEKSRAEKFEAAYRESISESDKQPQS